MSAGHASPNETRGDWTPAEAFWEWVEPGDSVRLQKHGWPPYDGYVDDRTSDGNIVWVLSVGVRRLFHRADGYSLIVWG